MTASAPPSAPAAHWTDAPRRDWLGPVALGCGLVGILVGLIPLMFQASGTLATLAIVFGVIGIRHVQRGEATNMPVAIAGLVTGVAAFALAVWGIIIVMSGLTSLSAALDHAQGHPATAASQVVMTQEDRVIRQCLFLGNS